MRTKIFEVKRVTNGLGHSNLLVITQEAIPDLSIGSALIVPYANGYRDPIEVELIVDTNDIPWRCNERFAIVSQFIYK